MKVINSRQIHATLLIQLNLHWEPSHLIWVNSSSCIASMARSCIKKVNERLKWWKRRSTSSWIAFKDVFVRDRSLGRYSYVICANKSTFWMTMEERKRQATRWSHSRHTKHFEKLTFHVQQLLAPELWVMWMSFRFVIEMPRKQQQQTSSQRTSNKIVIIVWCGSLIRARLVFTLAI